uniref:Uncharacterized protein n=1 Tax=Caenorhabditis japonica TaxID=281687 RepID=A0A8R1IQS3_CAEJA
MPSPGELAIVYMMDGPCKYFGALTCKIRQTGLIVSPSLESAVFCIVILAPALSPLTSLYFIRPYREFTKRSFQKRIPFGAKREEPNNDTMAFYSTTSAQLLSKTETTIL